MPRTRNRNRYAGRNRAIKAAMGSEREMTALNGFVKLHRKMIEWGWYSDCVVKDVFLHILMVAAYKPGHYRGYEIKPGQAIIGRKKMAEELGFSEQQVRTALKKLESTGEISIFSTNKFSIVTVENWAFYQGDEKENNQQVTNNQPTSNQQVTNNQPHLKNVKNVKNVKKEKNIYIRPALGEFENVLITEEELEKLKERFPYDWQDRIERLSEYMKSKGKRYKSHYATVLTWAKKDEDRKAKGTERRLDWIDEL